jgi:hypothetical protein
VLSEDGAKLTASVTHFTVFVILQPFTPFASPTLPSGATVNPLGIVSVNIPALPDVTPPTVTIDQAAGQLDPTSAAPINFTVVFSEPVTGFATGDVTLSGTASAGATATVTGSGAFYTVGVTGMTVDGTIIADIPADVASDAAGNPNAASTSTDNTVTFALPVGPVITSFSPSSLDVGTVCNLSTGAGCVAITGANFTGATEVTFDGLPVDFTVLSSTSIRAGFVAGVPAGASSGPIGVTNAAGTALSSVIFLIRSTINGTLTFNLFATDHGTLLPTAALTVLNPFTTAGTPTAGALLPTAALTVLNPFTTAGTPSAGTLLPTAALTVLNPFTTAGTPSAGTLLPTAALTVENPFTTAGTPTAGTLLPTAALTVSNPFTSAGTPTAGTLLPTAALTVSNPFTTAGTPAAGTLLPTAALTTSNISFTPSVATIGSTITIRGASFAHTDGTGLVSEVLSVEIPVGDPATNIQIVDANTITADVVTQIGSGPIKVVTTSGTFISGSSITIQ